MKKEQKQDWDANTVYSLLSPLPLQFIKTRAQNSARVLTSSENLKLILEKKRKKEDEVKEKEQRRLRREEARKQKALDQQKKKGKRGGQKKTSRSASNKAIC